MESNDITGAQIVIRYLAALVLTPGGRAVFCDWCFKEDADLWRAFAKSQDRHPTDPILAQDAVIACQNAVIEGSRVCLDKITATLEARQIIES